MPRPLLNRRSGTRRGSIPARRRLLALTCWAWLACAACGSTTHRPVAVAVPPPAATEVASDPTAAQVTTTPSLPPPPAAGRVRYTVLAALHSATASVDVAVSDLTTGQEVHLGHATQVRAASLTKLLIYLAAARSSAVVGSPARTAQAMIGHSDNDAATTLWRQAGKDPAVAGVVTEIGMTRTTQVPALFEPWDGWVTTADDQLRLLRHIHAGDVPGAAQLRALMSQVDSDQDWGAGRVPATTGRFVKNGWLPVGPGSWVVNTDGCMTADNGDAVCVAVTSTGSPTMAAGVAAVRAVAVAAVQSIVVP